MALGVLWRVDGSKSIFGSTPFYTQKFFVAFAFRESSIILGSMPLCTQKFFPALAFPESITVKKDLDNQQDDKGFRPAEQFLEKEKNKAGHTWAQHLPCQVPYRVFFWISVRKPDSSLKCLRICLQKLVSEPNLSQRIFELVSLFLDSIYQGCFQLVCSSVNNGEFP